MEVPPGGGGRPSPPTARRRTSIRNSLSGMSERGSSTEAALERSGVAILILRVDQESGPILHATVPDYTKDTAVSLKNPFIMDMIQEASPRLLECVPEKWASPRPRDEWVSLLKPSLSKNSSNATSTTPTSSPAHRGNPPPSGNSGVVENGVADIFYLAPRAVGVTDCSYFVLYLDKSDGDDIDTHPGSHHRPSSSSSNVSIMSTKDGTFFTKAGIRNRRRRIYGLCRRAPASQPYAVVSFQSG